MRSLICFFTIIFLVATVSCADTPPKPGQNITLKENGVSLKLSDGWTGEVVSADWTLWERIKKGRANDPWVIPPITVTHSGAGPTKEGDRVEGWRFKGVKGKFDPSVDPATSAYPVPPGLWSLDPQMLELQETDTKNLPWAGVSDIEATCRLFENTHGAGDMATLWHTYVVTFNAGENAYEFVMEIPEGADSKSRVDSFWSSIIDLTVNKN
jgi:hypothetical protein